MKYDKFKVKAFHTFHNPTSASGTWLRYMSQYVKDSKLINKTFNCDYVNLSTSRRMDEIGKKPLLKMVRFIWAYCIVLGKLMYHRYDLCYLAITCHGIGF